MKNLILVFLASIFSFHCFAQDESSFYDKRQNKVIATTGLNMRAEPSLKSTKVTLVPYGEKVEILEEVNYGLVSLGTPYQIHYQDEVEQQPEIKGYWVKASYEGQEGYLFSAYLDFDYSLENEYFNKDYILLFEGVNCADNFNYNPYWNWYGLFEEGQTLVLKKLKLSFFKTMGEMDGYGISTNIKAPSKFLIGSRKPLPKTVLEGNYYSPYEVKGSIFNFEVKGGINEELFAKAPLEIYIGKSNEWKTLLALNDREGNEQILNPSQLGLASPMALIWQGDLDGDGKDDYIIHYGEAAAQTVLYLSSLAEKDQLVKPAAIWFSGYCC